MTKAIAAADITTAAVHPAIFTSFPLTRLPIISAVIVDVGERPEAIVLKFEEPV